MKLTEVTEKIPAAMKRLIIDLTSVSKYPFELMKPKDNLDTTLDQSLDRYVFWYRAGTPSRQPGDQIAPEAEYINVIYKKATKGHYYLQVNTKGPHNKQVQAIVAKHRALIKGDPEVTKIVGNAHFPDRTEGV